MERLGQAKKDHTMVPMRGRLRRVDRVNAAVRGPSETRLGFASATGLAADGIARAICCAGCRLMPNFDSVVPAIRTI
jgi:hypothetical protein